MSDKNNNEIIHIDTKSLKVSDSLAMSPKDIDNWKAVVNSIAIYQAEIAAMMSQINVSIIQQQAQALAEAFKPIADYSKIIAETISLTLPDFKSLFQSYAEINFDTVFQSQLKEISKVAAQLSFKATMSVTQSEDGAKWQQETDFDLRLELGELKQGQEKILAKLDRKPTLDEAVETLEEMGMKAVSFVIKSAKMVKNELTINNHDVIRFEPNTIQSRFIGFFFSGEDKLKKRTFYLDEVIEKLETDYWNMSSSQKKAMKKRYFDARRNVNDKIKIQTAITDDFILLSDNKELSINQSLLTA